MTKNVIYFVDSPEAECVARVLQRNRSKVFRNAEFKELKRGEIVRVNSGAKSITHPEQENFPDYCALIWGSGKEHDLSLLMSPQEPFFKTLDDAHSDFDLEDTMKEDIDFENHVSGLLLYDRHALGAESLAKNGSIKEIVLYGNHRRFFYCHTPPSRFVKKPTNNVLHKSIDLDVIPDFPAKPQWINDGGYGLTLEELNTSLEQLCIKNRVVRFDVGGLYFRNRWKTRDPSQTGEIILGLNKKQLRFALNCYSTLLETYFLNCCNGRKA